MKLTRIEQLPDGFARYDSREFYDYEIKDIPESIVAVWYWYGEGSYEGAGQMLMLDKDGLWHHHDCGHCSCYGPTEINLSTGKPLVDLLAGFFEEMKAQVQPLVDEINKTQPTA